MPAEIAHLENDIRQLNINGHVGFDTIPDQLVNKAIVQGFVFNILCVGETGLGKSTLMETLFKRSFDFEESSSIQQEVELDSKTYDLKEGNVNLKLTITETKCFGNEINKEESSSAVLEFIEQQYEKYLQEELKMQRNLEKFHDTRPHLCLYFISPTGHSLKSLDLVAMKKLHNRVNIIPIIAKSDTINKAELALFKQRIMNEINENNIKIYNFPLDDGTVKDVNATNNALLPFAIVGSTDEMKINGKNVRVRQYPWGTVQVDNEFHCDFVKLRDMILRVNMEDLRERTHFVHYETYRQGRLTEMGFRDDDSLSLKEKYEKRREIQKAELLRKDEEMRQMFVERVREKEQILKDTEKEITEKYDNMKRKHMESKRNLEERRRLLDTEIAAFRKRQQIAQETQQKSLTSKKKK